MSLRKTSYKYESKTFLFSNSNLIVNKTKSITQLKVRFVDNYFQIIKNQSVKHALHCSAQRYSVYMIRCIIDWEKKTVDSFGNISIYLILILHEIIITSILFDFIFVLSNSLKWCLYLLGKPDEYKHHFNSLDKANIKLHNIDTVKHVYNEVLGTSKFTSL